jgi:hypothetical protein
MENRSIGNNQIAFLTVSDVILETEIEIGRFGFTKRVYQINEKGK